MPFRLLSASSGRVLLAGRIIAGVAVLKAAIGRRILFADSWTGPDGTDWPAQWTLGKQPGGGGGATIVGNQGRLSTGTAGGFSGADAVSRRWVNKAVDTEVLVRLTNRDVGGFPRLMFRHDASVFDGTSGYQLQINASTGYQWIRRVAGTSAVNLGSRVPFTLPTNASRWVRVRVIGSVLQARMWVDGADEPDSWPAGTDLIDDAITAPGYLGLYLGGGSAASRSLDFDDLEVIDRAPPKVAPAALASVPVAASWREAKDSFSVAAVRSFLAANTGPRVATSEMAPGGLITTQAQCDALRGRIVMEDVIFNPDLGVNLFLDDVLFFGGAIDGSFNKSVVMRWCTIDGNNQTASAAHFYPRGTWRLEHVRIRRAQDGIKVPSGSSMTGRDVLIEQPSQAEGALTGNALHQDGVQVIGGSADFERLMIDYRGNHDGGQGFLVKADAGAIGAVRLVDSVILAGGNNLTFEPHSVNAGPSSIDLGAGALRNLVGIAPDMRDVLSLFEPNGPMAEPARGQLLGSSFFVADKNGSTLTYANGINQSTLQAVPVA